MSAPRSESLALACLSGLRSARAQFFTALSGCAAENIGAEHRDRNGSVRRDVLGLLRSDGTAQIAELFFLIEELGLQDQSLFRAFLARHNDAMQAYLDEPDRLQRLGVSRQRIKAAIFSKERMDFLGLVSPPGQLLLDQAAIGRLLTEVMAPESCRKIVVALAESGLLKRHEVGTVLVSSDGKLEALFREHLIIVAKAVEDYRS